MTLRRVESPFDTYLREIQRYPLLTAAEERALAREIHDPELEHHEQADAREKLVRSNLRLVVSVAKRWVGRGLTLPDLVEEGNVGLLHAAELFDAGRQVRFSTYATWWIQQAIRRGLVNTVKTVRIPRHMSQELTRWRKWAREFAQREGREPDTDEIARAMKGPAARRKLLARLLRTHGGSTATVSLDALFEDAQSVVDPRSLRPEQLEFSGTDTARLAEQVARLPERESTVLRLRYGLDDRDHPMTLREIGKELDLSRERVRQLERLAVAKLRTALEREER